MNTVQVEKKGGECKAEASGLETIHLVLSCPVETKLLRFLGILGELVPVVHEPELTSYVFGQGSQFLKACVDASLEELTIVIDDVRVFPMCQNPFGVEPGVSREVNARVDLQATAELVCNVKCWDNLECDAIYFE